MAVIKKLNHKTQVKQNSQADLPYPPLVANRVLALYDAIVGSTAEVNSGAATHTSIQAAHDFVSAGSNVLVLEGTTADSIAVNINKTIRIIGSGNASTCPVPLNFLSGADFCAVELLQITGQITFNSGANSNFVTSCWIPATSTIVDSGSGNYALVIAG